MGGGGGGGGGIHLFSLQSIVQLLEMFAAEVGLIRCWAPLNKQAALPG